VTRGQDLFARAGAAISGWYPSYKSSESSGLAPIKQPFQTQGEFRLGLYLEYHPWVRSYQRGDISPAFARTHALPAPLGTPYPITYTVDDQAHDYLPTWVGTLHDGGLLIAAADGDAATACAARHWAAMREGLYWQGADDALSRRRHDNWVYLHARRRSFPTFPEIAPTIRSLWREDALSVRDLVRRLGARWSDQEIEAAAWKLAGDAAAAGHLLADVGTMTLDLDTALALLAPDLDPITPNPLPLSPAPGTSLAARCDPADAPALEDVPPYPGPTIDAAQIASPDDRAAFLRNLRAVNAVTARESVRAVARQHGMGRDNLGRLVRRAHRMGQVALVPYRSYARARALRPEFQILIKKLYTRPIRPTVTAVAEDPALRRLAEKLAREEGRPTTPPSYWQVYRYLAAIQHEPAVASTRSGLAHPPRPPSSTRSYALSIPAPAQQCQVDEHYLDLIVVALDGTVITSRVHAAVLVCVKTAAILGAVLSLEALKEEDYMRLVKQAIEPKDQLVQLYGCRHDWPCSGKPAVVFHDRGAVFTSCRATEVLVDRLGIVTERAPAYAPTAKGTVEAIFTWMTRKFAHRLPGTTKSNPRERGAYDSVAGAKAAGITLDVLEKLFFQSIVDGYMREWDRLRGQTRIALWTAAVAAQGVPRWLGSPDDLILLLMTSVNRRNPATGRYAIHPGHGLSFLGRWYVNPTLLHRLRGREISIRYDRRDISVIYLFLDGAYVGEAYCAQFNGRRVSVWEAAAVRKAEAPLARAAAEESRANRQEILEEARQGRRAQYQETKRLEQARQRDLQRVEAHPSHVRAVLRAMEEGALSAGEGSATLSREDLAPAVPDDSVLPFRRPAIRPRGSADG